MRTLKGLVVRCLLEEYPAVKLAVEELTVEGLTVEGLIAEVATVEELAE